MKFLLLFVFFVIGSLGQVEPEELFVMDCSGGAHTRKPGTDFYDQGVDLGILKRTIDEAVTIVHEHLSCNCPGITQSILENSFTPNIKLALRAMTGYKGDTSNPCTLNQLDTLLGDIMPDDIATNPEYPQMPNTCNYNYWQLHKKCSFKIDFPSNPLIGSDLSMYFAFSECSNSIWPHVSVSASGSFVTSFLKPCTSDSECGTMKCGVVAKDNDEHALMQENFLSMVNASLWSANIYKQESCAALGDVPRFVANKLLTFLINRLIGQTSTYQLGDELSMCGLTDILDMSNFTMAEETSTAAIRHRGIMKRAVSAMKKYPISQYINDMFNNVKNRGLNNMMMDTVNNLGINDMLVDASKKLGFTFEEDVFQARSLLQEFDDPVESGEADEGILESLMPKPKAWETNGMAMFQADRIDGTYYNKFYPETVVSGRLNLLRINSCSGVPQINIMGGSAKRLRSYVWKYTEVFKLLADAINAAVKCRPELATLNAKQILTRFFPMDVMFWQKLLVARDPVLVAQNLEVKLGSTGYDVLTLFEQEMLVNENGVKPQFTMPRTCTFLRMFTDGICSLQYDNLSPLLGGADVKIVFDYRRCRNTPTAFTMSIDCLGTDCQRFFDPFSIPCSVATQEAKCGAGGLCQVFEVCDPIGMFWNASTVTSPEQDIETGNSYCPQDSSTDSCIDTTGIRNRLVKAMLTINQDTTTQLESTDVGMCTPAAIEPESSDMANWGEDAAEIDDVAMINRITLNRFTRRDIKVKGLNQYDGSYWVDDTADGATPRPDGTFPESGSKKRSFSLVSIFFGLSLLVLS